jgi:hypothetical protein
VGKTLWAETESQRLTPFCLKLPLLSLGGQLGPSFFSHHFFFFKGEACFIFEMNPSDFETSSGERRFPN